MMMRSVSRAVVVIAVVFTVGTAVAQPAAKARRYDECLAVLHGQASRSPLVDETVATFARATSGLAWSVNQPYRADAINLLIPSGAADDLPASCGQVSSYPTCWSFAAQRQIICNTAMGRHLESPSLQAPFSMDGIVSGRFLFFLILGHEVGHLQVQRQRRDASHMDPLPAGRALACHPLDRQRDDVESRCDAIGAKLACAATLASQMPAPLRYGQPMQDIKLLFALENWLDHYHPADELCLGDTFYESFAARIQHFGVALLGCFGGGEDNFARAAAATWQDAFDRAEKLLRGLQRRGWAATPDYGAKVLLHQRTLAAPTGPLLLELDSDGNRSALRLISAVAGQAPAYATLLDWQGVSRPLAMTLAPDGWNVTVDSEAKTGQRALLRFAVRCDNWQRASSCRLATTEKTEWAGKGRILVAADGGILIVDGKELRVFADAAALARNAPSVVTTSAFMPEEPFKLAALGDAQTVVAFVMNSDSLYVADFLRGKHHATAMWPLDKSLRIAAVTMSGPRILFLVERRGLTSFDPAELWDCPRALLTLGPRTHLECHVYLPPPLMKEPLVLVTRAMSALDEPRIEPAGDGCSRTVAVSELGWTWLVRLDSGERAIVPADGIASCALDRVVTYRAGRNDELQLQWQPSPRLTRSLP